MKRMGATLGASQDTFSGLTGMGDLIVTCTSRHSRNRFVGYHIGKGKTLREITDNMSMVAEGVFTTRSVHQWSHQNRVDKIGRASCREREYSRKNTTKSNNRHG